MTEASREGVAETENSFANVLASLKGGANSTSDAWDDSLLAEDVASISYEQALRSQAAIGTPDSAAPPLGQIGSSTQLPPSGSSSRDAKRKSASVTIRLTEDEQKQLQERAAEARLSISAYLRSCIFETEALRTQVKAALEQMRAVTHDDGIARPHSAPISRKRFGLFSRWSHWREESA